MSREFTTGLAVQKTQARATEKESDMSMQHHGESRARQKLSAAPRLRRLTAWRLSCAALSLYACAESPTHDRESVQALPSFAAPDAPQFTRDGGANGVAALSDEDDEQLDDGGAVPRDGSSGLAAEAMSGPKRDFSGAQLGARDLHPTLMGDDYEGELCPPGSLSISPAPDGSAITVSFASELDAEKAQATVSGSCKLKLSFDVPSGHTFGNVHMFAYGRSLSTEGGSNLSIRYAFAGQSESQTFAASYSLSDRESFLMFGKSDRVWSPSCDGDERVELVLDIAASASGNTNFALGMIDFGFGYIDGAQWKRCSDGSVARPPASAEGEPCAGPPSHPCEPHLRCAVYDARHDMDELLSGACYDPDTTASALTKGLPCSDELKLFCDSKSVCHYSSEARRAKPGVLGACAAKVSGEGDRCLGAPSLSCGSGLFCSNNGAATCVAGGDGSQGSGCEDGIVECAEGFSCQSGKCIPAMAGKGATCGGPLNIRCSRDRICDPETSRCVDGPDQGKAGTACLNAATCNEGLLCIRATCRDPDAGSSGDPCGSHDDCQPELQCGEDGACRRSFDGKERSECDEFTRCLPGLICSPSGSCRIDPRAGAVVEDSSGPDEVGRDRSVATPSVP
jgi:hypothetical protein